MKPKILDGKKLSEKILFRLKKESKNLNLKLAVVLVGKNSASRIFINQKRKFCQKIGIDFELFEFPSKINNMKLKGKIRKIVKKPDISGLIIQLPLPKNIKSKEILNLVIGKKDVDVLSEENLGKFYQGTLSILPPTIAAIRHILKSYRIKIKGKNIVVVGGGVLIGKPLSIWLLREKATFSVVNKFTKNISLFTKKADILISGAGRPNLIKGNMVKKNVVVIDCGTSKVNGKIRGDVDFGSVSKKASYIAPVPGGVGPMTVAMLLNNLVRMSKQN